MTINLVLSMVWSMSTEVTTDPNNKFKVLVYKGFIFNIGHI